MENAPHPFLKYLCSKFALKGRKLFLAGGAVRDMLMGRSVHDWDLCTDAPPDEICAVARASGCRAVPTGIKHGTVTVLSGEFSAEITSFRKDSSYSDGRRPDSVSFSCGIKEDLARRDFTMNSIALNLEDGQLFDPFGGERDIKLEIIRCTGNPYERFAEDGLRPLRAVRFASQLGFNIEKDTLGAIPKALKTCEKVSWERVRDEFDKILACASPSRSIRLMEQTGLLRLFIKELSDCARYNGGRVFERSLSACDFSAESGFPARVRLAALFSGSSLPVAGGRKPPSLYTPGEEDTRICRGVLKRLRYPNAVIDGTCLLVSLHPFSCADGSTDSGARRFIMRAGKENLEDLFSLRLSCLRAENSGAKEYENLNSLRNRVNHVLSQKNALCLKDLDITGDDLLSIGIEKGAAVGKALEKLLGVVLDDPSKNSRAELLLEAGKFIPRRA